MKDTNYRKTQKYFAAANGYSGFRSYFKSVFNPTEYLRLFILKGGPGTGKNTLMKEVHDKLASSVNSSELIYCSSDTSSLDGVILKSEEGCVALIDGTAPHSCDPIYPGCIDEIVNLGEFWNSDKLSEDREKITTISKNKSMAYDRAYTFLKLAGECERSIDEIVYDSYNAKEEISEIHPQISSTRLIDAFGKDGPFELDTLYGIAKKSISVVGIWGCEQLYFKSLISMYSNNDVVIYPFALSSEKIKAVYIKSEDTAYIAGSLNPTSCTDILDISDLLDYKKIKENEPYLQRLSATKESLLWNSIDAFKEASKSHFQLEEIYKSNMDFSSLSSIKDVLINKISNILF